MVEQRFPLARVTRPTQPLDPSAGLPALAPVIENDRVLGREDIDGIDARPCAGTAPLVDRGVEPPRRAHENRRSRAVSFVIGINSIDDGVWHRLVQPFFWTSKHAARKIYHAAGREEKSHRPRRLSRELQGKD